MADWDLKSFAKRAAVVATVAFELATGGVSSAEAASPKKRHQIDIGSAEVDGGSATPVVSSGGRALHTGHEAKPKKDFSEGARRRSSGVDIGKAEVDDASAYLPVKPASRTGPK